MNDKKTFNQLSKGEAAGIFQLESNGMGSVLRQLQPDKFEEIIAVVALFRPGPMDNIPSFCNRKHGREKIQYMHPLLEKVLNETYGIIVYQEQVMQIAQVLSNYTLGEADLLRRAMGKKIQKEMDAQKNRFIEGAKSNKIDITEASKIFDLVDKFAGYGFNKSHAAGYALLAYQTAYLKTNFPYEFMTATLNYAIDRTDRIILLKKELARLNIEFKKPDINFSNAEFSIEESKDKKKCIRFGLGAIKGVGIKSMELLVDERNKNGKFTDIINFMSRLNGEVINKRQLEKLIQAGCFDNIEKNRAKLFSNVPNFVEIFSKIRDSNQNQSMLFEETKILFNDSNLFDQNISEWNSGYLLKNELEVIGFYFSNHPVSLYPKNYFVSNNIIDLDTIVSNDVKNAKIVGAILDIKERSNKDGKKYAFLTVSTLDNQIELSIFSDKLSEFRSLIKEGNVLLFNIDISKDNENLRLIVRKIEDFDKVFQNQKKIINIFLQENSTSELFNIFNANTDKKNESIYLFINKKNKLLSIDFSRKYEIKSFKYLDQLYEAKKIDYSIDFVENT